MPTSPLRFVIIGYGHIGKRHAVHIAANPDCRLAGVCDVREEVAQELAAGMHFDTDVQRFLENSGADVACICTPNYLHEPHTIAALNAGLHAVVEKPMALSSQSCERMIAASENNEKTIFAVKQNRYNPPVQQVKDLLVKGALGKVYSIQVTCFWNRSDAYYAQSSWRGKKATDGGCLFTQFSHFVDILYYLNGPVKSAKGLLQNFAHRHNTDFEDSGVFALEAANGALISFSFSTCSYEQNMEGSIAILCERGTVKIGGQYLNTIEYQHLAGEPLPQIPMMAKANDYGLYKGSMSNHDKVIQNVVDALLYGRPVMTSAMEGREVVSIIEQMYAGAQ